MDRQNISGILDSVYELEGLLHLALNREDAPDAIRELIIRKANEVNAAARTLAVAEAIEPVPEVSPDLTAPVKRLNTPGRGRLVFSLNDKYRYRRTLFDGSDNDFSEALSVVAASDSLEEAEGYFYSELGWDPENEEVRSFMEILANYYK